MESGALRTQTKVNNQRKAKTKTEDRGENSSRCRSKDKDRKSRQNLTFKQEVTKTQKHRDMNIKYDDKHGEKQPI